MHSNVHFMLSKFAVAMPFGTGAFGVLCAPRLAVLHPAVSRFAFKQLKHNYLIHLISN